MSTTEKNIQNEIRLHLSKRGAMSLRYQVGTFYAMDGSMVKIGEVGVSDLIACVPVVITPEMVGKRIGVFTAIETKKINDKTAKERKESQGKFIARVQALGGIATIARSTQDVDAAIEKL
jgi:hypothetical protein